MGTFNNTKKYLTYTEMQAMKSFMASLSMEGLDYIAIMAKNQKRVNLNRYPIKH